MVEVTQSAIDAPSLPAWDLIVVGLPPEIKTILEAESPAFSTPYVPYSCPIFTPRDSSDMKSGMTLTGFLPSGKRPKWSETVFFGIATAITLLPFSGGVETTLSVSSSSIGKGRNPSSSYGRVFLIFFLSVNGRVSFLTIKRCPGSCNVIVASEGNAERSPSKAKAVSPSLTGEDSILSMLTLPRKEENRTPLTSCVLISIIIPLLPNNYHSVISC